MCPGRICQWRLPLPPSALVLCTWPARPSTGGGDGDGGDAHTRTIRARDLLEWWTLVSRESYRSRALHVKSPLHKDVALPLALLARPFIRAPAGGVPFPAIARQQGGDLWPCVGKGRVQMASISVWLTSMSLWVWLWHFLRSVSEFSQLEAEEDEDVALPTAGNVEVTQETTESVVIVDVFGTVWYSPWWCGCEWEWEWWWWSRFVSVCCSCSRCDLASL